MKKQATRILSLLLVAAMLLGSALSVFASEYLPPREGEQGYFGENQPSYHGHNVYDVLNWSPETDRFAQFMKASVPLQERNDAFNAAQANPVLDQEVEMLSLSIDYHNGFFKSTQYNDEFALNLFNFWQYEDYYASWHGVVTDPTPLSRYIPDTPWEDWNYEFGVLNIPNPAYTNAAHKNGVKSLGCIFFPRGNEHTDDWVWQDENGNFPVADKLVELANWYGFDGYFINAEEGLPKTMMPVYEEFVRTMTSQGLYVNVYASNRYGQNNESSWGRIDYFNKDASNFSNWIKGVDDDTIAANSLYMNPGPDHGMVDGSVSIMESLGLDAKKTVMHTLEAGQTGFSGVRGSLNTLLDENGVPRTGIAALNPAHTHSGLDDSLWGWKGNDYNWNRRGKAEYQKYAFARERAWWTGSKGPYYADADSYVEEGVTFLNKRTEIYTDEEREALLDAIINAEYNPYVTANDPDRAEYDGTSQYHGKYQSWPGMAAFISERSVINGTNFYTSFNTGHGLNYYIDGKVSNDSEWANINDQDILPTWQWWVDTESGERTALNLDFDYGPEYVAGFDNAQIGGYHGGSSLAIFGDITEENIIHLYKTDLRVLPSTKLELTYNKVSATDSSELSLVLWLKDGEGVKEVKVPLKGLNKHTDGWKSTKIDLGHIAKGETIAAFGIAVDSKKAVEDYQINLGELCITDNRQHAPKKVEGFQIDRAFTTGEVYLSWDIADYDEVKVYNIYAVEADGTRVHVGATYDDIYYVKDTTFNPEKTVAFEITAEGVSGLNSNPVAVSYDFDSVTGLTAEAVPGAVNVTWENPGLKKCASVVAEVSLPDNHAGITETYTAAFKANATEGTVEVPVNEGYRYHLRLSFLDKKGNVLASQDIAGDLVDTYCAPYEGNLVKRVMSSGWKLVNPEMFDYEYVWVKDANGNMLINKGLRGKVNLHISDWKLSNSEYVEVMLQDFAGNQSEWVKVYKDTDSLH